MKKQVAVITRAKEIRNSMKDQIDMIFGDLVETSIHSLEDNTVDNLKKSDLYVISSSANEYLDEKFLKNKNIVIVDYTITKERKNFLKNFPKGTKAIFFNVTQKMCMEAIAMMYHLGVNNIEFIPAYPDMEKFPENSLIITPAETKLLPEEAQGREIIDIGHRILDANTIIEIALKLEFEHILYYKKIKEYLDSVATNDYSLSKILEKATQSESQLGILMGILDIAIIGVDKDNFICSCNESAEKILNKKSINLIGNSACDILSCVPFSEVRETGKEIRSRLVQVNGEYVNLNITPVIKAENYMGAFAVLQRFKEEEQKQHELRRQLLNKGHKAKYTFDDILGESGAIKRIKEIAKKMAKTNSAVLITGESGTGKELFAHAVHNYSDRKDYPFVAVNCAAIPENLLESELFGYEEGAFTGAKRGGKIGLFEFAHMGTLFLDEIEGMSPALQIKLLRVIQEKEIMRIGGDKVINIDVRIIAATNEELRKLIKENKFRKDLYYRINTLPIMIPPLREREDDIYLLLERFKNEIGADFKFTSKAKEAFKMYNWEGNIRELKNYVEFFNFMGEEYIDFEDMPLAVKEYYLEHKIEEKEEISDENILKEIAGHRYKEYIFILKKIKENQKSGMSSGRKNLCKICEKNGIDLSEQEIRGILKNLEKIDFIKVFKGRKGNIISEQGEEFLKNIK
ncbi:sigma 54-interacting transcriptional regulator [Fusobacterium perfoetens]|uniref:sigma-54 interaction domain-containing protein n=1 Tax=Fusobacterium perfoetens TaxID=852 RepID=UPI001F1BE729|nr:sigma 54-interacting transcriptional regulator [Fusobacterium perfoetens]MCF2625789.1 sigma 54-interacting transcriptional regulator [Fusobacterium perfoetens]